VKPAELEALWDVAKTLPGLPPNEWEPNEDWQTFGFFSGKLTCCSFALHWDDRPSGRIYWAVWFERDMGMWIKTSLCPHPLQVVFLVVVARGMW
jgi:hypothetical protein